MKTVKYLYCVFFAMSFSLNSMFAIDSYCEKSFDQHIDQVVVNEQGVFLLIDGCWLGSQGMQATSDGILVLENGEWISLQEALRCDNYYVWKCRICGAYNTQGTTKCWNYKNHPK